MTSYDRDALMSDVVVLMFDAQDKKPWGVSISQALRAGEYVLGATNFC